MPTLSKQERLFEKNLIDLLFSRGRHLSFGGRPVWMKLRFLCVDADRVSVPAGEGLLRCKLMVSASKRDFKLAVERNRVKRLLRESFRVYKDRFVESVPEKKVLLLFVQFVGKADVSYSDVCSLMEQASGQLRNRISHA